MTESVLVAAPERDEAITALFADHYAPLCRLAALLVGDRGHAEEIVMDSFAATLTGWRRIRDLDAAPAYLRRAVVNRTRSAMTRSRVEGIANAKVLSRTSLEVPAVDSDGVVLAAVQALPPKQRAAVVLTYFVDLPEAEVAAALRCSRGTVKSQLSKARVTLAKMLEENDRG